MKSEGPSSRLEFRMNTATMARTPTSTVICRFESRKLNTAVLCPRRAASRSSKAFDTCTHVKARIWPNEAQTAAFSRARARARKKGVEMRTSLEPRQRRHNGNDKGDARTTGVALLSPRLQRPELGAMGAYMHALNFFQMTDVASVSYSTAGAAGLRTDVDA